MKKGFTLIELLAVIVILAIIALIATPIILNIISNARNSANERSVELYAKAIEQAIAKEMLTSEIREGDISSDILSKVDYNGSTVECSTKKMYKDGSIYLSGCKVGTDQKEYTYGTEQSQQIFKPKYYSYTLSGDIGIGTTPAPSVTDRETIAPANKIFYLGYDVDEDDMISAVYACFVRNGNEYCLKGRDTSDGVYSKNQDVIREAFADFVDTSLDYDSGIGCNIGNDIAGCGFELIYSCGGEDEYSGQFSASAYPNGEVSVGVSGSGNQVAIYSYSIMIDSGCLDIN